MTETQISGVLRLTRQPEPKGRRFSRSWAGSNDPNCTESEDGTKYFCHSTGTGGDAVTLYKEITGCNIGEALTALEAAGIRQPSRRGSTQKPAKAKGEPKPVAYYNYEDESGEALYRVVRKEPGFGGREKTFVMEQPDGRGGWVEGVGDIERIPYRLPQLLATNPGEIVFIVEGEKDVATVESLGLTATCKSNGASGANQFADWLGYFAGRNVIVLPDNDAPGRKFATEVAAILKPVAATVRIIALPDLPAKGDVSDFIAAGGTRQELEALVAATKPWNGMDVVEFGEEQPESTTTSIRRIEDLPSIHTWAAQRVEYAVEGLIPLNGIAIITGKPGRARAC